MQSLTEIREEVKLRIFKLIITDLFLQQLFLHFKKWENIMLFWLTTNRHSQHIKHLTSPPHCNTDFASLRSTPIQNPRSGITTYYRLIGRIETKACPTTTWAKFLALLIPAETPELAESQAARTCRDWVSFCIVYGYAAHSGAPDSNFNFSFYVQSCCYVFLSKLFLQKKTQIFRIHNLTRS